MTTKVNRETFLHTLESVSPGVASREVLEQSAAFVFQKGRVLTFNDETCCRAPSGLPEDFVGAVAADPLLNLLRKLPEEEITIGEGEGVMTVTGKRRGAEIRMEKEITLPINAVDRPKEWTKLHPDFVEAIGIVGQCAGKDASQFKTVCVHIAPKWVEACDNFQLSRFPLKTGVKESVCVRAASIKPIATLGVTSFAETAAWMHFKNASGLVISIRRFVGEEYDLTEFLNVPKGTPTQLPKGLAEACDKATLFSSESDDQQVSVTLRPGKVRLEGIGASGRYWESKKINYQGPAMKFHIAPVLLTSLITRFHEAEITRDRIKVVADRFVFLACLSIPEEKNGEAADNGEAEE